MARLILVFQPIAGDRPAGARRTLRRYAAPGASPRAYADRHRAVWTASGSDWPGDTCSLERSHAPCLSGRAHPGPSCGCIPVQLTPGAVSRYYDGLRECRALAVGPLFASILAFRCPRKNGSRTAQFNEKFADRRGADMEAGDLVWVHDYQMVLVRDSCAAHPSSDRLLSHIPFPASEVMRILPWRDQVLEGLLGADSGGFHTSHIAATLFRRSCGSWVSRAKADCIYVDGREIVGRLLPSSRRVTRSAHSRPIRRAQGRRGRFALKRTDKRSCWASSASITQQGLPRLSFSLRADSSNASRIGVAKVRLVQIAVPSLARQGAELPRVPSGASHDELVWAHQSARFPRVGLGTHPLRAAVRERAASGSPLSGRGRDAGHGHCETG